MRNVNNEAPETRRSVVPQKAKQRSETERPTQWTWVEASIWTDQMLTALGNGVKGGKWFSLIDKVYSSDTLWKAWKRVAQNNGAAGIDRMTIMKFQANEGMYLKELGDALKRDQYQPEAIRRVYIPKGKNKKRPLGIPTVKDRIVQMALKMVIEPIFENEFKPFSFGFRPNKGCKNALREVDREVKQGKAWVVEVDIKEFFDTIPHDQIIQEITKYISDGRVINLIKAFLNQKVISGMESWNPIKGAPQGAIISPLLANIYLHNLDVEVETVGFQMIRYADDFVILCTEEKEAERALNNIQKWMEKKGLETHPEKTRISNCTQKGQGFEFLGYLFENGRRWVRRKSLKALRDKIRAKTKRTRSGTVEEIIKELNPTLRGWFEYFKHANKYTFSTIDSFARRRLRTILRKRNKMPLTYACRNDSYRWPNKFFAKLNLFTMHEAYILASRSR